ncbi:uncharacterized protein FOKN1_0238 [Thiohalobacter thiocyanaticus]|uniref:DUF91 domain-containing protein n=1 Tax=Thiohalobacter thiocyanaticus TaxID=585455 RepID=A0A1Z4VMH9_9GAMM|nr:hypothetical protein [Thiohalobacter thiocyanaticus]BAZ92642.1 uncharacterized protein FOKN1_0238 [Thiohalobacter thiocyanaticus]
MPIYTITDQGLIPIHVTRFADEGLRERDHLQQLLRDQIEVIEPDILVISEEFGSWEDSRRRIDLLAIDKSANLVVIELKRTDTGGHMELQAVRYAAMVSALTFRGTVDIYERHLDATGDKSGDAREKLLEFLEWEEPDDDQFAQDVRIILAAAEFSKEITTSVLWLIDHGLDIKCIRLRPYKDNDKLLLDVQQVIPLPEAEEYQIKIRDKTRMERVSRTQSRDFTKFDLKINGELMERLPKRQAIFHIIKALCQNGVDPEAVRETISWRRDALRKIEGVLDAQEFEKKLAEQLLSEGKKPYASRYFINDEDLIIANESTYAVTKMWGKRTTEAINLLLKEFPGHNISYETVS